MTASEVRAKSPLVGDLKSLSGDVGIDALADEITRTVRHNWVHFASMEVLMPTMSSPTPPPAPLLAARLAELRLAVIDELNDLTASYIVAYMENAQFRPSVDFFKRLLMLTDRLRNLFSQAAFDAFKQVDAMIGPNLGPTGEGAVHKFIEARNAALAILYREAGIAGSPPPP